MLSPKGLGLTLGIFAGAWWLVLMLLSLGMGYGTNFVMMMGALHPGFSYSYGGAIWMTVIHLVGGYIVGYVFASLYNTFSK